MKRCRCVSFAGSESMFHGGRIHWNWWMSGASPDAHHPSCEKYDKVKQIFLVQDWLEREYKKLSLIRTKLEKQELERLTQKIARRGKLKLV